MTVPFWVCVVGVILATVIGYALGADNSETLQFQPIDPGDKVLVPMDDGDAIAIDEAITWTFGSPREQHRLKELRRRYLDARLNAPAQIAK